MMQAPRRQKDILHIDGERVSGQDIRTENVTAVTSIANVVKSSLGPIGLDKMIVDDIGDVLITNDGATILQRLEVEHPAAKVLVELADLQDREVGDGTTTVVILAAELLKRGNELIRQGIHPTTIISGYRLAAKEACRYVGDQLSTDVSALGADTLTNVARTSMSSKVIGADSAFFAKMVVDACLRVKEEHAASSSSSSDASADGKSTESSSASGAKSGGAKKPRVSVPLASINVLKAPGKAALDSAFIEGFALNCTVASSAMVKDVQSVKLALLDFNLQKARLNQGVQVLISDPDKIADIKRREEDLTKERIQMILKTGANVVMTTKGIDDMACKYFIEAGVMAVRRCAKDDLKQIAKATGAQLVRSLADLEGDESFDAAALGTCERVTQERIGDQELILLRGTKAARTASIILRGSSTYALDEMSRSIHDSLCAVKRTIECGAVVAGGGAVEAALSVYLDNFATTLGSREQMAIAEFAEALLVIPKQLAINAACDATDMVAKLRSYHYAAQTQADKKQYSAWGLDLYGKQTRNNTEAGVVEPTLGKIKCLQFATDAAISILRIDELVRLNPKPEPQRGVDH